MFAVPLEDFRESIRSDNAHIALLKFNYLSPDDIDKIGSIEFEQFLYMLARGRSTYMTHIVEPTMERFRSIVNRLGQSEETPAFYSPLLMTLLLVHRHEEIEDLVPRAVGSQHVLEWFDKMFERIVAPSIAVRNWSPLRAKVLAAQHFVEQQSGTLDIWTPQLLHVYYLTMLKRDVHQDEALYEQPTPAKLLFRIAPPFERPLDKTYDLLILHYLLKRDRQSARSMLLARKEMGYLPNVDLFVSMLDGYRAIGNNTDILKAVQMDVNQLSLNEDVRILNALIALHGHRRDSTQAWETFTTYFDLYPYLPSDGLLSQKPRPNAETFVRLLRGCVSPWTNSAPALERIRECMLALRDAVIPGPELALAEIEAECALGNLEQAFVMLEHIQTREQPNPFTLPMLPERNLQRTLQQSKKGSRNRPSIRMVNMLFRATLAVKGADPALKFLLYAKKVYKLKPNEQTTGIWLEWYLSQPTALPKDIVDIVSSLGVREMTPEVIQWRKKALTALGSTKRRQRSSIQGAKHRAALASVLAQTKTGSLHPRKDNGDDRQVVLQMRRYLDRFPHKKTTPGVLWRRFQTEVVQGGRTVLPVHMQVIISSYLALGQYKLAIWTLEKAQKRFQLHRLALSYLTILESIVALPGSRKKADLVTLLRKRMLKLEIHWDSRSLRAAAQAWARLGVPTQVKALLDAASQVDEAPRLDGPGANDRQISQTILFNAQMSRFVVKNYASSALIAHRQLYRYLQDGTSADGILSRSVKRYEGVMTQRLRRTSSNATRYRSRLSKALRLCKINRRTMQEQRARDAASERRISEFLVESRGGSPESL